MSTGGQQGRYLFASYSRTDWRIVTSVASAIEQELHCRSLELRVWTDALLRPGESFSVTITKALEASVGLIVFVSSASMSSNSVLNELRFAAESGALIIAVSLDKLARIPEHVTPAISVDLSRKKSGQAVSKAAKVIADAVETHVQSAGDPRFVIPSDASLSASEVASEIATTIRNESQPSDEGTPHSVFVVHGHDYESVDSIVHYLEACGIEPILLSNIAGPAQSLFQKFLQVSTNARFAIVVFSADDVGASRSQYDADGVADRALQFRPRQNVVLELGFFYGRLGWENVFVVLKPSNKPFPNFERPSDLDGVVFDELDKNGRWQKSLGQKLRDAGFEVRRAQLP